MEADDGVVADTWLFQNPADPDEAISYRLASFPIEPWKLTHTSNLWVTADEMHTAAGWLDDVASRLAIFGEVSQRLGAPSVDHGNPVPGLAELGSWLQAWFHLAGAPLVESGFLQPQPGFRLGTVYSQWAPWQPGYSATADALVHSLVVDLATLVSACARVLEPDLAWSVQVDAHAYPLVLRESSPIFAPLEQIWDVLRESVGVTRGERDRNFWRRRSTILVDCFQQAVTGRSPPGVHEGFSEYSHRAQSRFRLKAPPRATPRPSSYLVDAVRRLRSIGWFESWNRSDEALAQAAAIEWRRATARELPSETAELWWCLLFLDGRRTWFEDVDMQILPRDWLYTDTLFAVDNIGGKGFGGFSDPEDDWFEVDGSVVLSFRWRRRKQRLVIRQADGVLDPDLFTELNALLPDDMARLHFADHGPGVGVVVRATEPERTAFTALTGIRLTNEPPQWWRRAAAEGPASLRESPGFDPLLLGAPAPSPVIPEDVHGPSVDDEYLRRVSITDYEADGEVVIQVSIPAAEFLRGGEVERALDEGLQRAIRTLTGVTAVHRTDREVWEVSGNPDGGELEDAATSAVSNVLDRFADEIEL